MTSLSRIILEKKTTTHTQSIHSENAGDKYAGLRRKKEFWVDKAR